MPSAPIAYLDHAATTPVRPEVVDAILPFLGGTFGNPSGVHGVARAAKTALEEAREVIAACLGCEPGEVVLTGGGTEGDNLAVKGASLAARDVGLDGVVVPAFEHHAVLESAERLAHEGSRLAIAPVGPDGVVDVDALADLLDARTAVVSVMLVNNEVGTIQPLAEVARVVAERAPRAVLHTDAVQAVSWVDVAVVAAPAQLVTVTAHKVGGPKGTGALVVRRGTRLRALVDGGGQERGLRSGTVDVAGAVGLATALRLTTERRAAEGARLGALRDRLQAGLLAAVADVRVTGLVAGRADARAPGFLHLVVPGVESEALLLLLDREGVCASAGSACSSGAMEPSHVLGAMGIAKDDALSAVRLSLGWASTDADVDRVLAALPPAVARLRAR
jgi:cysteine desulfurase